MSWTIEAVSLKDRTKPFLRMRPARLSPSMKDMVK